MSATASDLASLRDQHAQQARENALRIQEFAGYIVGRIDAGRADAIGMYAADIVSAGQRIMTEHATIQGLDILATEPATDREEDAR
jgi:hypothetical protein